MSRDKIKRVLSAIMAIAMVVGIMVVTDSTAAAAVKFTDVPVGQWYYEDVYKAVEMNLINGKDATTFAPDANLKYSEAVKLAACMHQLYTTGSATLKNGEPWYQSYVDYCKKNKIISKDYAWETMATRAGYMEIFANSLPDIALEAINTIPDNAIPDVSMDFGAAKAIYKLYRAGIVNGVDAEHSCKPLTNIRRREVATILARMMDPTVRKLYSMDGSGSPTLEPGAPTLEPGAPTPEPGAPTPEPGAPTPEPGAPTPEPGAPTPEPGAPTPEPGAPTPEPETPVAELIITKQPEQIELSENEYGFVFVYVEGGKEPYTFYWEYEDQGGNWYELTKESGKQGEVDVNGNTLTITYGDGRDFWVAYYRVRCTITDADGKSVTTTPIVPVNYVTKIPELTLTYEGPKNIILEKGETVKWTALPEGGVPPYKYIWEKDYSEDGGNKWQGWLAYPISKWPTCWEYNGESTKTLTHAKFRCTVTDSIGHKKSFVVTVVYKKN